MSDTGTLRRGDTETEDLSPRRRVAASALPFQPPLDAASRGRLHNLLVAKSIVETLFVVGLAVGFYYVTFNPYFRGALDVADARRVAGWAIDEAQPSARVEVQLYIDGRFVESRAADANRPDVAAAGRARDDRHGFEFTTPALQSGEHEARVYAVHASGDDARRVLQLVGKPLRFRVGETGEQD